MDGLAIYYYRARYYNPMIGRFLSEAPMGFAGSGTNLYAYAGNDPIDFIDPMGLDRGPNKDPNTSKREHCIWEAAKDKGISMALDIVGSIPVVGNATSATAGVGRAAIAVDHALTKPSVSLASGAYGAYGAISAGTGNSADSLAGAGSAGAGIGLTLADLSLEGTKAIPIVGNAVSALTFGWDAYQAYKTYQACMAEPGS